MSRCLSGPRKRRSQQKKLSRLQLWVEAGWRLGVAAVCLAAIVLVACALLGFFLFPLFCSVKREGAWCYYHAHRMRISWASCLPRVLFRFSSPLGDVKNTTIEPVFPLSFDCAVFSIAISNFPFFNRLTVASKPYKIGKEVRGSNFASLQHRTHFSVANTV